MEGWRCPGGNHRLPYDSPSKESVFVTANMHAPRDALDTILATEGETATDCLAVFEREGDGVGGNDGGGKVDYQVDGVVEAVSGTRE